MAIKFTDKELFSGVKAGDTRAISRLITLAENGSERARKVQAKLFKGATRAHVVGITGPPGAGKSTLVDCLSQTLKARGKKVAVLAIDPTSPFTGGAILGDRIRMVKSLEQQNIYVRSMATRGALGGISRATLDAVHILEAAGYDAILIETVGVGQAEVDIIKSVDSCVVVLVPGLGDSIQAMKAGVLEIADIFVVNKSDRDGADRVFRDIRFLLTHGEIPSLEEGEERWEVPVLKTVAVRCEGVQELADGIDDHADWLKNSKEGERRRKQVIESRIKSLATQSLLFEIAHDRAELLSKLVSECQSRKLDIYGAVQKLVDSIKK